MISADVFKARRDRLTRHLNEGSIALIPSASEVVRNSDVHYPFRQNSDFFYLTGFNEPDALAVLVKKEKDAQFILFCRDKDPTREQWDGYRAGVDGAIANYQADKAYSIHDVDKKLPQLMENCQQVYYPLGVNVSFDQRVHQWLNDIRAQARLGKLAPSACVDICELLHEQRLIKSTDEIAVMQKSADISSAAHVRAMKASKPGIFEYELEAEILHEFGKNGARQAAYSSIVGGGDNACILHYICNDQPLKASDLVLIDAGCDYHHYAADITRTFPVSGTFSEPQKAIYEIVLNAQLAAIDLIKPGVKWHEPHELSVRVITQGLIDLGLLEGDLDACIAEGVYKAFYMHRVGHWLGMDVHDVGRYKIDGQWRSLEVGMALTVEPGIYIAKDNLNVEEEWRGIGIRIEDDIVVEADGCRVLTQAAPKTIQAIEALMLS